MNSNLIKIFNIILILLLVIFGFLFLKPKELKYGTAITEEQNIGKALPAIEFTDENGQKTFLNESNGKMRLIFYGFVRCPDVCPISMNLLANTYDTLNEEEKEKITIQLISVDPNFDQPDILKDYVHKFNKDFKGLTGTEEATYEATQAMFVGLARPVAESSGHNHSEQNTTFTNIVHGDQISVVDTKGNFVRIYSNDDLKQKKLDKDLKTLIKLYSK